MNEKANEMTLSSDRIEDAIFRPFSEASMVQGLKLLVDLYAVNENYDEKTITDILATAIAVHTFEKFQNTKVSCRAMANNLREKQMCEGK